LKNLHTIRVDTAYKVYEFISKTQQQCVFTALLVVGILLSAHHFCNS